MTNPTTTELALVADALDLLRGKVSLGSADAQLMRGILAKLRALKPGDKSDAAAKRHPQAQPRVVLTQEQAGEIHRLIEYIADAGLIFGQIVSDETRRALGIEVDGG